MSASVITDIRISHTVKNNVHYYGFFTKSYEKNVYPHQAYPNCEGYGTIEQLVAYFFKFAAYFEGGSLQGPSGHVLPETILSRCYKALRNTYRDETLDVNANTELPQLGKMIRNFVWPTVADPLVDTEWNKVAPQPWDVRFPRFNRLDEDDYQVEGYEHPVWAYKIMSDFITKLPPCSNYRDHIKTLREALKTATVVKK